MTDIPHPVTGRPTLLLLHRLVFGLKHGDNRQCDHRNKMKLDCQRGNLRILTNAQNNQDRTTTKVGASPYRGVAWDKARNKWTAQVRLNDRNHHLGRYDNELDAARAASRFRAEHMPYSDDAAQARARLISALRAA